MYTSEFLPLLQSNFKFCKFFKCIPFDFDEKKGRFVKATSPRDVLVFKAQCVLSLFYCGAMFGKLFFGNLSTEKKFQGVSFLVIYTVTFILRWNYSLNVAHIQIINGFMDFESSVMKGIYLHTLLEIHYQPFNDYYKLCTRKCINLGTL